MIKLPFLRGVLLSLINILAITSTHAQAQSKMFEPGRGRFQIGAGYQYEHYNVLGQRFHDHGVNADFSVHAFDLITGASSRLALAAEGTGVFGFGHTGGTPNVDAKSYFVGGGPHVSLQNNSPIEPWIHVLPGWQQFRFTQGPTLTTNSAFGFMAGAGLDFRLAQRAYWRVQADYIGTHFQHSEQSNYSVGSGLIIYF
jgi:Outer membrane protein beta-barrel domain